MLKKKSWTAVAKAALVIFGGAALFLGADQQLSAVEANLVEETAAPFEVGVVLSEFLDDGLCGELDGSCERTNVATDQCCPDDTCWSGAIWCEGDSCKTKTD